MPYYLYKVFDLPLRRLEKIEHHETFKSASARAKALRRELAQAEQGLRVEEAHKNHADKTLESLAQRRGRLEAERGQIEWHRTHARRDFAEQVPRVVLVGGRQRIRYAEMVQEMTPVVPRGDERLQRTQPVQFVAHGVGIERGEGMRVGVGHAAAACATSSR